MTFRSFALLALASIAVTAQAQYEQDNLVSDGSIPANFTDSLLANPWGMASSATGPIWIADNASNFSTLYGSDGSPLPLQVVVPGGPTGIVFNTAGGFSGSHFIFDNLNGQVMGWSSGTSVSTLFDMSSFGASYTGLTQMGSNIYAADAGTGMVDVFNSSTGFLTSFTDPTLTALGYSPFGIQAIGSNLYVTFSGMSGGFVDVFDSSGNLESELISQGALDCPWGVALAPSDFGEFSNDLLIGNNDDLGWINAYNPNTGAWLGTLNIDGAPISDPGLWAIGFGNGHSSGPSNELFFTAGPNDSGGLYGDIRVAPGPAAALPLLSGLLAGALRRRRK